jgi:hypothetical protein
MSKVIRARFQSNEHFPLWKSACQGKLNVDRFCSSPLWGVPLNDAFQGGGALFVYTVDGTEVAIFAEKRVRGGVLVMPVDNMWLLGTPLLSHNPEKLLRSLIAYWVAHPMPEGLRQIMISGLYPKNPLTNHSLWKRLSAWEIDPSGRMIASLEDGMDGFMGRRSKNFRSRLRRTVKSAEREGISVEFMPEQAEPEPCAQLLERVFSIEGMSWKGRDGRGIDSGGMRRFYESIVPLLASEGRLRGLFLTREGQDLAYLFGGFFDGYFRGLQFSYLNQEQLGLGNVCQYHMIGRLIAQGCQQYDLGQAMQYKSRWSENHIESRTFVFQI